MALLRDNLFVDGLDSFALSTDEALAEPTSDDLLHSYPGTVSIFLCCLIISRQRDFARSFMSSCPIIVRSFFLGLTVGVQISDELVALSLRVIFILVNIPKVLCSCRVLSPF